MYTSILIPVDGSPFSERAIAMAVSLAGSGAAPAGAAAAHLVLVHAVHATRRPGEGSIEVEGKAIEEGESYLARLAKPLMEQGLQVETTVPYGEPVEEILATIVARNADLVVMCTHGRSGLGRWVYGSVAEAVLAKCPAPVLLVPPTGPLARAAAADGVCNLLVPLDGSTFAETALSHAEAVALHLDGTITLLRVAEPNVGYYPDPAVGQPYVSDIGEQLLRDEEANAKKYLDEIAARLTANNVKVRPIVRVGFPAGGIIDEAELCKADLIIMATHGRTGLGDRLMGSVAHEVLHHGRLPILLVRPTDLHSA